MTVSIEEKYKQLDEITHILHRSGMYLGSIEDETNKVYIPLNGKMECEEVTYMPSFQKLFDEIITNSSDESRRQGSKLDTIKVNVDQETGYITVWDNGGIPVVKHKETNQYVPEMIFTNLRAGSNFDDTTSDTVAGTNGLGSKISIIFSTDVSIETGDGKKIFSMNIKDNMSEKSEPKIKQSNKKFTQITYKPDFEKLKMPNGIDDGNFKMMLLRTYEIAACNPHLTVYFNDEKINLSSFEDYIHLYTDDFMFINQTGWRVGIAFNTFETPHTSYVNGIRTLVGGTHVDHVMNIIVDTVRDKIKQKTKQNIRPSEIKNMIHVFIDCDIKTPRFTSQTKEKMINQPSGFDNKFEIDEKLAKKILSSNIFTQIVEWASRKQEIEQIKDIENKAKQVKTRGFHDIPKYRTATSKNRQDCTLFIVEGDCLHENTEIQTFDGYKTIKDVKVGDLVLTHNNRYKPVIDKAYKVKESITIKTKDYTIIVSKDHRLLVYVPSIKQFGYVKAKDFTNDMKLVKSRLIEDFNNFLTIAEINKIEDEKYDVNILMADQNGSIVLTQKATWNHAYLVYSMRKKEYVMKKLIDINLDDDLLLYKGDID